MDPWVDIRRAARECHEQALAKTGGDRRASAILAAARENDDLELRRYEPGTIVGDGVLGFLQRDAGLVNVQSGQRPEDEAAVVAHEIGHYRLHRDPISEIKTARSSLGGDAIDSGAGKVEGYSSRERKEVQADVFAGEFLCPSDWLRIEYLDRGRRPREIAIDLGVPFDMVLNQTIRALLLPPLSPAPTKIDREPHTLDESQRAAAMWPGGPLLVDAGPGTGKTRTLIHRVQHLLKNGVGPASILALTFSNKAAEEMRERLSVSDPPAAIEMWVGTFHAFGLELVTKWPARFGRTAKVRVLDQEGALGILEDNLARLPLHYYQNLYEPAFELAHVLRAISRCKDELIGPDEYLREAQAAEAIATTEGEIESARKAVEVAGIYAIYEQALKEVDAVDFGDLVLLATRLLEEHPDVRAEIHARFKHVLVDEYQDVNAASARLLKALQGEQTGVWVVADQRQSIYRFRGAEPSNVVRFEKDFFGSRQSLGVNYRSREAVVGTFQTFSAGMGGGVMAGSWRAHRTEQGEVSLVETPTLEAEADAIRKKIEDLRRRGVPYREQAILARTHLTLSRLTGALEQLGVPLLYLGDLFEREEVRDLLSLVALDAEFGGAGLVRVAALPEYGVPREDALRAIGWSRATGASIFAALEKANSIQGLSEGGREGLARLGSHLKGMGPGTSPWTLLTAWLFERSGYLRPLLASNEPIARQKLIAIYHLLKVCGEQIAMGDRSRRRLVQRVRRIEALNQDSSYRAVASEASDMDAVRVSTIHGSKGLEFGAVHIPALATRYLPVGRQGVRCPPPPSLGHLAVGPEDHEAEEECLFFVALSRARDHLCLTRAERYTTTNASASKYIDRIGGLVRRERFVGTERALEKEAVTLPQPPRDRYSVRELEVYMQCPARYRYEVVDGLLGERDGSAYLGFHHCVYATIGWMEDQRCSGRIPDVASALGKFSEIWSERGPVEHAFAKYYRAAAESMVTEIAVAVSVEDGSYERREWSVSVGPKTVTVTPDRVVVTKSGAMRVQRVRTGRKTKSEQDKPIYALLRRGAVANGAGRAVSVETYYLATGEAVSNTAKSDDKLLDKYLDAIHGIERGSFRPEPDARSCPNCQFYFMCGA